MRLGHRSCFSQLHSRLVLLQPRLKQRQKSVLSLGMSTRDLGAAFAPLFAISSVDQRAIVMVAIGVPMQTIFSLLAARSFARRASASAQIIQTEDRQMRETTK